MYLYINSVSIYLAYYLCIAIGAVGGTAVIGIRSHLAKVVDRDEIGKIMSFMAALDTLAPVISTTLFTIIFKYTIDTWPGTVYLVISVLVTFPIFSMMWIDLYTEPLIYEEEEGLSKNNYDENIQNHQERLKEHGIKFNKKHFGLQRNEKCDLPPYQPGSFIFKNRF